MNMSCTSNVSKEKNGDPKLDEEQIKNVGKKPHADQDDGDQIKIVGKKPHADQDDKSNEPPQKKAIEHSSVVAAHYNHLEEKGLHERFNSPIYYLRNFNNWVKSVLIQEFTDKIREKDYGRSLRVLDICCGKGGDLSKWQKARVEHVVFADIAEVSVQQCQTRYDDLHSRSRGGRLYSAEFIAADCSKDTLRDKYRDPSIAFDVVSCQFGLHYSFESLPQAKRMLTNISECLKPGGFFFGTIPDANEIVSRGQKSPDGSFGNRIYNIKLLFDVEKGYPLFGGKYDFHLEGVVDCPEFLVNFKLFTKLALDFGLELVYKARFADFFKDHSEKYRQLLQRIVCFESYPPPPGKELIADEAEYEHAKQIWESKENKTERDRVGTMSACEWEVASEYLFNNVNIPIKLTLKLHGNFIIILADPWASRPSIGYLPTYTTYPTLPTYTTYTTYPTCPTRPTLPYLPYPTLPSLHYLLYVPYPTLPYTTLPTLP